LADPAGLSIDLMLEVEGTDPRRPRQLVARSVFTNLVMCLVGPQILTLSRQRRLPRLDQDNLLVGIGPIDPAEVVWDTDRVLTLEGDPLAGEPGVSVVGTVDEMYEILVGWTVATMEPVLEAIRSRVRVGRNGLWGAVVDFFMEIGPDSEDSDPKASVEELARFEAAAKGTPLGQPIPVIRIPHPDGDRLQVCRASCCLYYKEPIDPDEVVSSVLRGPWERYCTTCPLIPTEETVRRLVSRLQHLDEKEHV
jgi:hypothetical protein